MKLKTKSLAELCKMYQPKTLSKKQLKADGKYSVYGANGIIGKYDKYNHEEAQLLITCRGATCGSINISEPFSWINGNAMVIQPNKSEILREYLEYLFKGPINLSKITTGAAQPQITRETLNPILISYPSLIEQRRIVDKINSVFAEIDELIKITNDVSKNIKILLQNFLKKIFLEGKKDWVISEIKDLCDALFAGGDVQKKNLSKFKTDKFNIPIFTNGEKNKGLYGFTDKARVFKPSITVSARGTIGYTELRTEPFFPAIRLIVITPNTNIVQIGFLKHAIKTINFFDTGSSIPQLTVPKIKELKIKFPVSKDAQKKIVLTLDNLTFKIDEMLNILKVKIENYLQLKQSILKQELSEKLKQAS